jgi:hypothetical protein
MARLLELRQEIQAIERLLGTRKVARGRRESTLGASTSTAPERTRRKPVWSAAKRRAAAERMRKYWASRKAQSKR